MIIIVTIIEEIAGTSPFVAKIWTKHRHTAGRKARLWQPPGYCTIEQ